MNEATSGTEPPYVLHPAVMAQKLTLLTDEARLSF